MGEATYYLRARFPSPSEAKRVSEELRKALGRLLELNQRWQSLRQEHHLSCAERRRRLRKEFPDLKEMVPWAEIEEQCRAIKRGDRPMNCCAGPLPDIEHDPFVGISESGDEILLSDVVWHFTSWDGLAAWLRSRGATACNWLSDEQASLFDCIKLD